jgi:hypothetical protein
MHRNDARVSQAGRDVGLAEEVPPAFGIIRKRFLNPLEGNFALQLLVVGDVNFAEATPSVESPRLIAARGDGPRALRGGRRLFPGR